MTAQQLEWETLGGEQPGSLRSFGRQLRQQHGGVARGLDDQMIGLLEKLFDIPYSRIHRASGEPSA
jgi:hypothetical protein